MLMQRPLCGVQTSHGTRQQHTSGRLSQPLRTSNRRTVAAPATGDVALYASYAGLGLTAASFVTTFFVLPRFINKNADWNGTILPALRKQGVRNVTPSEAYSKARSAVLVDVRTPEKFNNQAAAARSINVPLYIDIQDWDVASIVRRLGFFLFGVAGTELNPNFIEQVQAAVPKGREIMVICEMGGSVDAKPGNISGNQSRSLKAIYLLQEAGQSKVCLVQGGLSQWIRDGLPTMDEDDDDQSEPELLSGLKGAWGKVFSAR
mmetsp:Transcript_4959/g.8638  ORF Transcript_4959/g.8638 Transcript_4959/m.8638 type:complete len:262 (-) Transcript_4959:85-870(-)|eukprot:CAMPEP_0119101854 /NCGR_PEP_ID=MMETSP1180-20130426/786_1 /TAXON_ID=3052 ORGANISM="Chlamydomonas cf sp, Strain CCMP681" /NCGR_SAMPLE_ID=MMETSP1180 /ASSEMBLY_ACC=CAM_ASM_000741 /LENGTH=261 /DNA_ID=CAMNT_0007086035 /DNA_START=67 /DNA_END=852 /DNA_ORIENTATION=+